MPLFRRFGRPGLLGAAARTAVVAGTATATVGAIQRHQSAREEQTFEAQQLEEARAAERAEAAARDAARSAPAGGGSPDLLSELERLGRLHTSGALTDAEFAQAKAAVLGTSG